jgi:hypothetical protein
LRRSKCVVVKSCQWNWQHRWSPYVCQGATLILSLHCLSAGNDHHQVQGGAHGAHHVQTLQDLQQMLSRGQHNCGGNEGAGLKKQEK